MNSSEGYSIFIFLSSKRCDLSLFDLVCLEQRVSRYQADVFLPQRKVTRQLVQEIMESPDPPPRPKPVRMKVNRYVVENSAHVHLGSNLHLFICRVHAFVGCSNPYQNLKGVQQEIPHGHLLPQLLWFRLQSLP